MKLICRGQKAGHYKIYGLRTTDCGLRTGHGYKTWTGGPGTKRGLRTRDYAGLGIKHGLRYKTLSAVYGLGIKHGLGYKRHEQEMAPGNG